MPSADQQANPSEAMTIDDLARITHTPRLVGRLPVGSTVVVFDGEKFRQVTSFDVEDDRFVLVIE
jgi:ATP-dependent protease Clp ATPase subunit